MTSDALGQKDSFACWPHLFHSSNLISSFKESKRKCFARLRAHDPFVNHVRCAGPNRRRSRFERQIAGTGRAKISAAARADIAARSIRQDRARDNIEEMIGARRERGLV